MFALESNRKKLWLFVSMVEVIIFASMFVGSRVDTGLLFVLMFLVPGVALMMMFEHTVSSDGMGSRPIHKERASR